MITTMEPGAVTEPAALLVEMLAIPSVSTEEERLGQWLLTRLERLGFSVERDGVGNVVANWGSGSREVMLVGHMDTVPGWIPVRREGNRLFGRGAVDAKGPLAAAIAAVTRQPGRDDRRFTLIAAVEEEGSSRGARYLVGRPAPAVLVVLEPSGWDAITLGYKGSLRMRYCLTQPTGHGAGPLPSAGDRAIDFARRAQDHVSAWGAGKGSFDRIDVRVLTVHADGDGLQDVAALILGFRLPTACDVEALKSQLGAWAEGAEVRFEPGELPVRAEKNTALVRSFLEAIRLQGGTPRFKLKTGTSDMNILVPAWGCPALAYGPGDSKLDHTPEEAIDLAEYARGIEVLTEALRRI